MTKTLICTWRGEVLLPEGKDEWNPNIQDFHEVFAPDRDIFDGVLHHKVDGEWFEVSNG